MTCRVTGTAPGGTATAVSNVLNATTRAGGDEDEDERDAAHRGHRQTSGKK
jgi:hypothetical protein